MTSVHSLLLLLLLLQAFHPFRSIDDAHQRNITQLLAVAMCAPDIDTGFQPAQARLDAKQMKTYMKATWKDAYIMSKACKSGQKLVMGLTNGTDVAVRSVTLKSPVSLGRCGSPFACSLEDAPPPPFSLSPLSLSLLSLSLSLFSLSSCSCSR